jgi:hypothetical protein
MQINWNLFSETREIMAYARTNRSVFLCILGISWFWFVGAVYLTQLPNFSLQYLGGNEQVVTLLLALFSIGVGCGSLLCEKLTGRHIDIGLVPIGALGLTVFGMDLGFVPPLDTTPQLAGITGWIAAPLAARVMLDIVLLGMFGGFYIVPLYAFVQQRSDVRHRCRIIAANNVLNALLMVCAAVLAIVVLGSGFTITDLFLTVAALNTLVSAYIFLQEPEFIRRFVAWIKSR